MAEYTINGVTLAIPDAVVTGQLDKALASRRYEHTEADALLRHLRPADRFFDCGAGAGYLVSLAARAGVGASDGVEANPDMVAVAQGNLARNGGTGAIIWGAAVRQAGPGATVAFSQRRSFWASSLVPPEDGRQARVVDVPALPLADLLDRFAPSVLSIDIEGGEADLAAVPLPPSVRLVLMELHPAIYGPPGVKAIFDALSGHGFGYVPSGSRGATVVFGRAG